jgi:drug/metabolite transporter (DMT)-like permease
VYLLLALAAAAAYGAADFLGGVASRRSPIVAVIIVSQALALVLVLMVAPLLEGLPTVADFLWGAAAGLAYGVGLILLYRSLASGQMSVVAPITGICAPSLPVLFGLLLGEKPGAWALIGIALAIVAIMLISRTSEAEAPPADAAPGRDATGLARSVVFTSIGAGVAIGFFFIALARTQTAAGLWPLVATRAVTVGCYLAIAASTRQSLRLSPAPLRAALAGGALDICANTLYLLSVRGGLISLAATVTSLYPATTVLLASVVLRERLHKHQTLGLACAVAALLLITATQ